MDEDEERQRELEAEKARDRAEAERLVGSVIGGKYRVDAFVGGGAMGKVYRATQLLLDKTVAVKVLHAGLGLDEKFQSRFHREAKAASKMDHPNSVTVIDFGIDRDGLMFIVMEFLAGRDLFTALRREWPFSIERTVSILSQVLSALAFAHDLGIVHRDLKPENIMLVPKKQDDGTIADVVKVADFGIAKILDDPARGARGASGERLSTAGNIVGTPEYMSPEQAQARTIDGRADLYSCGVILYELCTGTLPFSAETPIGMVLEHITRPPPDPRAINGALSAELSAVILKALAKSPDDRFSDARAMRAALRAAAGMADVTTTALSASAIAAIAAIDSEDKRTLDGLGRAATIANAPGEPPRSVSLPQRSSDEHSATIAAPTSERSATDALSGPAGDRTHSTTASQALTVARESLQAAPATRGVSTRALVTSMLAALCVGALGVVVRRAPSARIERTSREVRDEPIAPRADSLLSPPSQTPAPSITDAGSPVALVSPRSDEPARAALAIDPVAPRGTGVRSTTGRAPELSARAPRNAPQPSSSPSASNAAEEPRPSTPSQPSDTRIQVTSTQPAQGAIAAAQPSTTPPPDSTRTIAMQPREQTTPATPTLAPLASVRARANELRASGGVIVHRLQTRAQSAADALARCALSAARSSRSEGSFTDPIDVTLNLAVAERRLDRLRMLGGPSWLAACAREAEPAFAGDLPEADDPEYTITVRVSLSPQR